MACCPFHRDSSPSFGVDVDTGTYNCFGCGAKGTFASLVKHLDGFATVFDAEQYLITAYGRYRTTVDEPIELSFKDDTKRVDYFVDDEILRQYRFRHEYLSKRVVKEDWQKAFEVGYNKNTRSVTFPYRDEKGRLITVKHRRVYGKSFWYEPPLPPRIKAETLYALDKIVRYNVSKVAITEAEIDCMSVWQAAYTTLRIGAVAIGGNQFTVEQAAKMICLLPSETEVIVFTDNDVGGRLARSKIVNALSGRFTITEVDWTLLDANEVINGQVAKDANDVTEDGIRRLLTSRRPVELQLNFV